MSLYQAALTACREGRFSDGVALAQEALRSSPADAKTLNLLGMALTRLGQTDAALSAFDRAIASDPILVSAHANRAGILLDLGRHADAVAGFDRALALDPAAAGDWSNRAVALAAMGRTDEALAGYAQALQLAPQLAEARLARAALLRRLDRPAEALPDIDAVLASAPSNGYALLARAEILQGLRRYRAAADAYEALLHHHPGHRLAYGAGLWCRMHGCELDRTADASTEVQRRHRLGAIFTPMHIVGTVETAAAQRPVLHAFADYDIPNKPLIAPRRPAKTGPIRLGYFGADFNSHAIAVLAVELFEQHDRSRYQVSAISLADGDGSAMHQRVVKAFDRFVDVRGRSDDQIADAIVAADIDLLVDISGFTEANRPKALACHPAPIQVSYLGFPGTSASSLYDYIIADETVIPPGEHAFYSECVASLPRTYQVNSRRSEDATPSTRAELGLPADAFVFCCFNNSWKLTAPMFDIWMRLLAAVDGSVLWLLDPGGEAAANLCAAAQARGVEPGRIHFAPRVLMPRHMTRQRAADLFLDTLPYNAHTTASDALWAGLPIVTCVGHSFAGRVAASLLRSTGLDELVTTSLPEYEALALKLALDPGLLARVKLQVAASRPRLFDMDRFRREIEAAYDEMVVIHNSGSAPRSFRVQPL